MAIKVPPAANFSALKLTRDAAGGLHYRPEPLSACCSANGFDIEMTLGNEVLASVVIAEWYLAYRKAGGRPDSVADEILAACADKIDYTEPRPLSLCPGVRPVGEFMDAMPFEAEFIRLAPHKPGCYLVYVEDQPYYVGMSRKSIRTRLWLHSSGRGSKMIREMLAAKRPMYFEYCDVQASDLTASRDPAAAELVFMLLLDGKIPPGNLRVDGVRLFPDPTISEVPSLIALLSQLDKSDATS